MSYKQVTELYNQGIGYDNIALLTGKQEGEVKLICDNHDLECRMNGLGSKRFNERQEQLKTRGRDGETAVMLDFVHRTLKPVAKALDLHIATFPKALECRFMKEMDSHSLALSAIRVAVGLAQKDTDVLRYTTACILTMNKVTVDMEPTLAAKCGRIVLNCLIENTDDLFEKKLVRDVAPPHHNVHILVTTDKFREWEKDHAIELAELAVMFRPMVVPPRPWDGLSSGGYHHTSLKRPFIRNRRKLPLSKYGTKAIPRVYEAVNRVQATPFAINNFVLDVALKLRKGYLLEAEEAQGDKDYTPAIAHRKFLQLEPVAPHDRWAKDIREAITKDQEYLGLDKDAFEEALQADLINEETGKKKPKKDLITFGRWIRQKLLEVIDGKAYDAKMRLEKNRFDLIQLLKYKNALTSVTSKNRVINTALEVAIDYREFEAIFFPHNLDWRGRIYPMTAGLTTQGVGLQKALLKFDKGIAIGSEEALDYLLAHVAGCWGLDKAPWFDRLKWTTDNREFIQKIADNPVATYAEWKDADSPWLFIAACKAMSDYYENGLSSLCDIPCPHDGTCNGAQHYAAMTRDTQGAYQVNVMPNGTKGLQERLDRLRGKND